MLPLIPLAIGAAIGAVGGLALAPKSGKENLEDLGKALKIEEVTTFVNEKLADIRAKGGVEEVLEEVAEKVEDAVESASATATRMTSGT